ncbi:MAG: hypothetical protein WA146_00220 [Thiobacillus sp.]
MSPMLPRRLFPWLFVETLLFGQTTAFALLAGTLLRLAASGGQR